MDKNLKYFIVNNLCIGALALATMLVLAVAFVPPMELLSGEVIGQWSWFSKAGILFSCIAFCAAYFRNQEKSYFPNIVVWGLIILGGIEAVWGLGQLYGFSSSNHTLYAMTGTFFNPGPYSGYLAMLFPLCLNEYLILKNKRSKSVLEYIKYYLSMVVALLVLCTLPAGMSRSAWMAVFVSGLWVCGIHYSWFTKLKGVYRKSKRKIIGIISISFITLVLGSIILFHLKQDSAYGRLFMWKISILAIAEKPFGGYGTNKFPMAYGMAQEAYFSKGEYSLQEEWVAGSPEYAFNEYLHVAVEWGIPVLICILSCIFFCLWKGLRKKYIGVCGAIISIMLFGGSSYPIQLPVFIITLAYLLAICVIGQSKTKLAIFALMIGGSSIYWLKMDASAECKQWIGCHVLYRSGAYQEAVKRYEKLYPKLKNRAVFMYEYGYTLHKLKQYDVSIERLKEGAKLSCDPMFLNIIGKNYQNKGEYGEAERYFTRSSHLLPGRIYPYYLLAKLYAEPQFQDMEKLEQMIEIVIKKKPKVESAAVREMKEELQKIRNDFDLTN